MIDEARFTVSAGNGGSGAVSFRRDIYGSAHITLLFQLVPSLGDVGGFMAQAFHVSR